MALQPASGARDLLPRDVGVNRWIAEQLAAVTGAGATKK